MTANPASPPRIVFEPLHVDVERPKRGTSGSAGYDLCAYLHGRRVRCSDGMSQWDVDASQVGGTWTLDLPPRVMALIPLGFRARLPEGFEAQVRPRSGVSFKKGLEIPNAPGTVDADYPDEWMVPIRNGTTAPMRILHGERVAPAIIHRFEVLDWEPGPVSATTDRRGGFGSTGH